MAAAESALDVATHNLAGAPCDGFHRLVLSAHMTSGGIRTALRTDENAGELRRTGRDLDFALSGHGRVRLCDGTTRATVSCTPTSDGFLRSEHGALVMGLHGALRFPLQAKLEHDGSVTHNGATIDRIATTQPARLEFGVVEGANTDSMHAMIDVLEAQRHFETAQKTTQTIDSVAAKDAAEIGRAAQ